MNGLVWHRNFNVVRRIIAPQSTQMRQTSGRISNDKICSERRRGFHFHVGSAHSGHRPASCIWTRYIAEGSREVPCSVFVLKNQNFHWTGLPNMAAKDLYETHGVCRDAGEDETKNAFHMVGPVGSVEAKIIDQKTIDPNDPDLSIEDHLNFLRDEFSNTFDEFFHSGNVKRRSPSIEVNLQLTLFESVKGCIKHLSFIAPVQCDTCKGSGYPPGLNPHTCLTCKGIGKVTIHPFTSTCLTCKGAGHVVKGSCYTCKGCGTIGGLKEINVNIPEGIESGDVITVPEAGVSGRQGFHPGDLKIRVQVLDDSIFRRDGDNIYVDACVSLKQAILGGKIKVPMLSGDMLLEMPKGVQPGDVLLIMYEGIQMRGREYVRGDQYVQFGVKIPTKITERQRSILKEIAKEEASQAEDVALEGS